MKKTCRISVISTLILAFVLCLSVGISFLYRPQIAEAEEVRYQLDNLRVENADGESYSVKYVNPDMLNNPMTVDADGICLFTAGHASYFTAGAYNNGSAALVSIDSTTGEFKVKQVINASDGTKPTTWAKSLLCPGSSEFVLLGYSSGWTATDGRTYVSMLAVDDVISLKLDDKSATVTDILEEANWDAEFENYKYSLADLKVGNANGTETDINWINPMPQKGTPTGSGIVLYTAGHTSYISDGSRTTSAAILVDAETLKVKAVYNQSAFTEDTWIYPQAGEFVLVAFSASYASEAEGTLRKFIRTNNVDDVLTLKLGGEDTTIAEILEATAITGTMLKLDVETSLNVTEDSFTLSGQLNNASAGTSYTVHYVQYSDDLDALDAEVKDLTLDSENKFSVTVMLKRGANYFDVWFVVGDSTEKQSKMTVTVTFKEAEVNPYVIEGLEVVSAPATQDTAAEGVKHEIRYVNPDFRNMENEDYNYVVMFTAGHESFVTEGSKKTNTAIIVDANTLVVKKVLNKAPSKGVTPSWSDDTCIVPADNEFVLLGVDSSYANAGHKKYIAENFAEGDKITLLLNNETTDINEILALSESQRTASMKLTSEKGAFTTFEDKYVLTGRFEFPNEEITYKVLVKQFGANGEQIGSDVLIAPDKDYNFEQEIALTKGLNYIQISYTEDGVEKESSRAIVSAYYKVQTGAEKEYVMWVDQFSSSINSKAHIKSSLQKMKNAGVTAIALEVKGTEGYASYMKTTYTEVPYYTETKNKQASVAGIDYDTLEEVLKEAKAIGIKVYAAFNFFTEGVIQGGDSAVLSEHPEWEEVLYAPEGGGDFKTATEMNALNSTKYILNYVNPANDEVVDFQLKRVKEVLENYDVDGIVMDRTRYDNRYADFSDVSKAKFEEYLAGIGKTLNHWPQDVYTVLSDGSIDRGSLYYDWYTFRASVIKDFADKLKATVDSYNQTAGDDVILAAYVGNSYESMWEMGLNWATDDFKYTDMLGQSFGGLTSMKKLYNEEYNKTSYLNDLDFLMVGTYGTSAASVESYATLANIVTDCRIPVYASIDFGGNPTPESQREIIQTCVRVTEGCMLFSASSYDPYKLQAAIADREYVKPESFVFYSDVFGNPISIDKINTSRGASEYCYYDVRYGTADANVTSVVVAVDKDGNVIRVENKEAVEIITDPEDGRNTFTTPNCEIPEGGFVIATPGGASIKGDPNDTRRVLSKLSVGDKFTAVYLTDYVQYVGEQYDASEIDFTFSVAILGYAEGIRVSVNGVEAVKGEAVETGDEAPIGVYSYSVPLTLKYGANDAKIVIESDDMVILSQTVEVISTKPTLERIVPQDTMYSVEAGKTINLNVNLYPAEAVETITYKSNDTSIATVDAEGNVTGVKAGKTTITIMAGEKSIDVTITVSEGAAQNPGLTTGAIVGIVLGSVAIVACVAVAAVMIVRKKKRG